ncbi:hypothetical protein FOVSG1_006426 [Fusarium oxysporum f. sp. vasinfectum]
MASSSQQPTDFTSQPKMTIDPTVDVESASSEVLNFDCMFRATYPKKGQFGPSGKRRTKGAVPDHMEAQTEYTGGVACKRTSIQK